MRCSGSVKGAPEGQQFCAESGTRSVHSVNFSKANFSMQLRRRLIIVATLLLCAISALAQAPTQDTPSSSPSAAASVPEQAPPATPIATAPPLPETPQPKTSEEPRQKTAQEILDEEKKQKMMGIVPIYGMTNYSYAPALTSGQKFDLMIRAYATPFPYLSAGFQAGLSQAFNSFEGYGQGASGYGKRFGSALLDGFDSGFFSNYFYPVLFKQDPRYFRLGSGSTKKRRLASVIEQEFLTKKDSDRSRVFSYSNVFGALTAGGISNAYYPQEERGFGLTMSRTAVSFGWGIVGDFVLEFWPDISHKLHPKRTPDDVTVK